MSAAPAARYRLAGADGPEFRTAREAEIGARRQHGVCTAEARMRRGGQGAPVVGGNRHGVWFLIDRLQHNDGDVAVLVKQCLDRRIADPEIQCRELKS